MDPSPKLRNLKSQLLPKKSQFLNLNPSRTTNKLALLLRRARKKRRRPNLLPFPNPLPLNLKLNPKLKNLLLRPLRSLPPSTLPPTTRKLLLSLLGPRTNRSLQSELVPNLLLPFARFNKLKLVKPTNERPPLVSKPLKLTFKLLNAPPLPKPLSPLNNYLRRQIGLLDPLKFPLPNL